MPRQTLRLAAISRHHIDVQIAGVFTAEGDPFSVRREVWIGSLSLKTGEATGQASGPRHNPDVLRIRKCDLRRAYGWGTQQACAAIRSFGVRRDEDVVAGEPDGQQAQSKKRDGQNESPAVEPRFQGEMRHQFSSR